eukprot:14202174-Heterocapsa_arctica.AAC.1
MSFKDKIKLFEKERKKEFHKPLSDMDRKQGQNDMVKGSIDAAEEKGDDHPNQLSDYHSEA